MLVSRISLVLVIIIVPLSCLWISSSAAKVEFYVLVVCYRTSPHWGCSDRMSILKPLNTSRFYPQLPQNLIRPLVFSGGERVLMGAEWHPRKPIPQIFWKHPNATSSKWPMITSCSFNWAAPKPQRADQGAAFTSSVQVLPSSEGEIPPDFPGLPWQPFLVFFQVSDHEHRGLIPSFFSIIPSF